MAGRSGVRRPPTFISDRLYLFTRQREQAETGLYFYGADRGGQIVNDDPDIYMGEGNDTIEDAMGVYAELRMNYSGVFGDSGESNFTAYRAVCITQYSTGILYHPQYAME